MFVKAAFFALFVALTFASGTHAKILCAENESVNQCGGCDGTCEDPSPACIEICVQPACRCKAGYVRGPSGGCIETASCPAKRSERDAAEQTCGENESWRQCAGCEITCEDLNPVCFKMCQKAQCQCKRGFVRHPNGKCVQSTECPKKEKRDAPQQCPTNEQYNECSSCEGTCENPSPICTRECRPPKCQCVKDHVRHENGTCVPSTSCNVSGAPIASVDPRNDPCAVVRCAYGPCVVKDGRAQCTGSPRNVTHGVPIVPTNDPCALVRCANGPCVVKNGQAVCSGTHETEKRNVDPCSTITCEPHEKCEWVQINCFVPPCPQDPPKCVPIEKKEGAN